MSRTITVPDRTYEAIRSFAPLEQLQRNGTIAGYGQHARSADLRGERPAMPTSPGGP